MKAILKSLLWLFIVLLGLKLVFIAFSYFNFELDYEFLLLKQDMLYNEIWKIAFYVHLFGGGIAVLAGMPLFSTKWIKPSSKIHRYLGRAYFFSIMFLGGPTGLYLAFFAEGGYLATVGFIGMSFAWMMPTLIAVHKIMQGDVEGHYRWIIRSYTLTLSGVTLRMLTPLGINYWGWSTHFTFIATAYIPWIFNWIIAEIIVYLRSKQIHNSALSFTLNERYEA